MESGEHKNPVKSRVSAIFEWLPLVTFLEKVTILQIIGGNPEHLTCWQTVDVKYITGSCPVASN